MNSNRPSRATGTGRLIHDRLGTLTVRQLAFIATSDDPLACRIRFFGRVVYAWPTSAPPWVLLARELAELAARAA